MKVHLIGAITGNQNRYKEILAILKLQGHSVITDHFSTRKLQEINNETPAETEEYRIKSQRWIKQADVVIFEATSPSIGIGYEIALAVESRKPIIILFEPNKTNAPHPLLETNNERIQVLPYKMSEVSELLIDALEIATKYTEVRFTMILPGDIISYLDEVAHNGKTRSDYIRELIKKDMKK